MIVIPIFLYHQYGIDWVIIYAAIDIDFHLDELLELVRKHLPLRVPKK